MKKSFFGTFLLISVILVGVIISLSSWDVLEPWDNSDFETNISGTGFPDIQTSTESGENTKIIYEPVITEDGCPSILEIQTDITETSNGQTTKTTFYETKSNITLTPSLVYNFAGKTGLGFFIKLAIPIGRGKSMSYSETPISALTRDIKTRVNKTRAKRTGCVQKVVDINAPISGSCTEVDCNGNSGNTYQF